MTKEERTILSPMIKSILKYHKYIWEDLKEEVESYGMRGQYPTLYEFQRTAENCIKGLEDERKEALLQCLIKSGNKTVNSVDKSFIDHYTYIIQEEIKLRAERVVSRS